MTRQDNGKVELPDAIKRETQRARKPRFDRDKWHREWPALCEITPEPGVFVHRNASLAIALSDGDEVELQQLASQLSISTAGLALRILCTHLYGRYLLVKMQLERRGLFARGNDEDPRQDARLRDTAQLDVPQRMYEDLAAQAARDGVDVSTLTGAIVRAHLFGHPRLVQQE